MEDDDNEEVCPVCLTRLRPEDICPKCGGHKGCNCTCEDFS